LQLIKTERFSFTDDNFLNNKTRTIQIANGIIKHIKSKYVNIEYFIQTRADSILKLDKEVLRLLIDSGLRNIFIGAESGSNRVLEILNKQQKKQDIIEVNRYLKQFKEIIPEYSFMINFPFETEAEQKETFYLIDQLKKDNNNAIIWKINSYLPYPGTPLAEKYPLEICPQTLDEWGKLDWYHSKLSDKKTFRPLY
jgi:anaerobic magnesium-protoporphyrin IX monomethyl ester cyclase